MSKFLGVDPDREFYLLTVVRRAVVAPFPEDWAVGASFLMKKEGDGRNSACARRRIHELKRDAVTVHVQ